MVRRGILALLLAAFVVGPAHAAGPRHDTLPLHAGSAGPRVATLKYELRDPRPKQNVFSKVKGTYQPKFGMGGFWNDELGAAVFAYKYRLGYPAAYNSKKHPIAGPLFFRLLRGEATRPGAWVALAAARLKATEPGVTALAKRIRNVEIGQLGVTEYPPGSNCGPTVRIYQSVTGAFCAAWCVSFTQWAFRTAGYGTFADRTAGVFYAVGWARARNLLFARPKVGSIVAFMDGQGHMGTVTKITASGFVSIEGNASNRVLQRFHTLGDRRPVFIYLHGVA